MLGRKGRIIFIALIISIFYSNIAYSQVLYDSLTFPGREIGIMEEAGDISAFSLDLDARDAQESLRDTVDLKSLYRDSDNNLRGIYFRYTGSDTTTPISVEIGENTYSITPEPDKDGYVYCYFNPGDEPMNTYYVDFALTRGTDRLELLAEPVALVEGNADLWTVSEDGHTLLAYLGSEQDITIPNYLRGKIITTIEGSMETTRDYEMVFYSILKDNTSITSFNSITLSEGIVNIGICAFSNMASLQSVILPDTLENIRGAAFADSSLTGEITIPEGVESIYSYAFINTNITGIRLNNGLKNIYSYAFYGCTSLKGELSLPESLEVIDMCAFYGCTALEGDLTIPYGVDTVGDGAFFNCGSLKGALTLQEGVREIGLLAFGSDGSTKSGFTSLSLPTSLRKIGPYAFQYCTGIKTITLPEGLEIISDGAFDHMSGLEDEVMLIPSTVHTIGGDYSVDENTGYGGHVFYDMGKNESFTAFQVAEGNEYFTTMDGVLYSADMTRMLAYPRGKRDTEFQVPEGITQIDEMAFSRAYYLNRVILPDSYVIGEELPANILNQDANTLSAALYVYTSVNEIEVKDTNSRYTTLDGMVYSKDMKSLYYIPNKYTGQVNIPEGVINMEKGCMFAASKSNTGWTEVHIPSSMVYIHGDTLDFLNAYFKGYVTVADSLYYTTDDTNTLTQLPYTKGDVNMDNGIDRKDVTLILQYISGIDIKDGVFNRRAGDLTEDMVVDILDAVDILTNLKS